MKGKDKKRAANRDESTGTAKGRKCYLQRDDRGISEVYGTVLVIALAFLTAVLLVGIGSFVIQDTTEEFEDGSAQNAMFELDDRMGALQTESANGTTEFEFPQGSQNQVSSDTESGQVSITVESTVGDDIVEETETSSYEFDLGAVTYESTDGKELTYQGGGLWERTGETVSIASSPSFDYDGTAVDFSFVSFGELDAITQGGEVAIQQDDEAMAENYGTFLDEVAPHWRVEDTDFTAPVDVTITIESEFADAWRAYAENEITEPLTAEQITFDEQRNRVTFELENVGSEFELETSPADFESGITYAGLSEYTQYNEAVTPGEGSSFTVEENHSIAVFDPQEGMWAYANSPWRYADGTDDGSKLTNDAEKRLPVVEPTEQSPGQPGTTYELLDGSAVCIAEDDSIADHLDEGNCEELFGASASGTGDFESFDDEVTVAIDEISYEDGAAAKASEESVEAELTVKNEGDVLAEPSAFLADFDNEYVDSNAVGPLEPGEEEEVTLEWSPHADVLPPSGERTDEITAIATSGDEDSANVEVVSATPTFEVAEDGLTIGENRSEGQTLTVSAEVENTGVDGAGTVSLETPRDSGSEGTRPIADTEKLALEAGETEPVELSWQLVAGDSGTGELTVSTGDDAVSEEITVHRGAQFAGLARDAPFLTDRIEVAEIDGDYTVDGGTLVLDESEAELESGYPLDPAESREYAVYGWDGTENKWNEIEPIESITPTDTSPPQTGTAIQKAAMERFGLASDEALTTAYNYYELQPNTPVCFVGAGSSLDPNDACGEIEESDPLTVSEDGELIVDAAGGSLTVLDTQIGEHVTDSELLRDPADVAFLLDESEVMTEDDYETKWPHSGPANAAVENLGNLVESDPIAEIHDPRRLIPFSDTVTGGIAVYQEQDTENVVDREPEADMLTTGYYLDYGTLEGLANDFSMHVRGDDGEWLRATADADSAVLDPQSPVAEEDLYYIWSGAVGIGGEVVFMDIDDDEDIRIQADTSDFPLVGSDEDEIGAQDPNGNRYTAIDAFADRLFDSPPEDRASDLYFTESTRVDDSLTADPDSFAPSTAVTLASSRDVNFAEAIDEASSEIADGDDRTEHIVLISAGVHGPDAGLAELNERDQAVLDAADSVAAAGQTVHTIGLGEFADRWLLETVAERTGGSHSHVTDAGDLTAAMNETVETELLSKEGIERDYVTIDAVEFDENGTVIDSTDVRPGDADNAWNANDPRRFSGNHANPAAASISEVLDGSENRIGFEWEVSPAETGQLARTADGEVIESEGGLPHSIAEEPRLGSGTTTLDGTDAEYTIYTDGDGLGEHESADWQPAVGSLDVLDSYLDEDEFDLGVNEAIVVAEFDEHPTYEGYSLLHFEGEERFQSEDFAWQPSFSAEEGTGELNVTQDDRLEVGSERLELTTVSAQIGESVDSSPFARPPLDVVFLTDQSSSMVDEFETVWPHSGEIGEAVDKWDDGEYITETTIGELEEDGFGLELFTGTDVYHDWENCGGLLTSNCDGVERVQAPDWETEGYHINYGSFDANWVSTLYFRGEDGWIPFERDDNPEALVDPAVDIDREDVYYVETPSPVFDWGDGAVDDVFFFAIDEDTDVRIEHHLEAGPFGLIELLADVDPQDPENNREFAVNELAEQLGEQDRVSNIYFDAEDTTVDQDLRSADAFEAGAVDEERFFDEGIDLATVLEAANDKLDGTGDSDEREEIIVLLTDGIHAMGENDVQAATVLDELTRNQAARASNADRDIFSVGLGPTADRWLLRSVSEETTDGVFFPVLDASDLQEIYSDELAAEIANADAIERDYTTVRPIIDGSAGEPINFGLADGVNVNDPETFNDDRSVPRSTMLEQGDGLDGERNLVGLEIEIASCEEGHAVDADAALPDGTERTYTQCTEPGTETVSVDSYRLYEDGDELESHSNAPWQQDIETVLDPYLNDGFELDDHEAVIVADIDDGDRMGYVVLQAQARPALDEQLPAWARAIDNTEFDADIVEAQTENRTITDTTELAELTAGETVELTVNVTNRGDGPGQQPVVLESPHGDIVDTETPVFREAGESGNLTLEWETEDGDSTDPDSVHSLNVKTKDDTAGQRIAVLPARPQFEIESATALVDEEVGLSDPINVEATVRNEGVAGDGPVWLKDESDSVVDITNIAGGSATPEMIDAGESETVILEWTATPGELAAADGQVELTVRTRTDEKSVTVDTDFDWEQELLLGTPTDELPPVIFDVVEAEVEN